MTPRFDSASTDREIEDLVQQSDGLIPYGVDWSGIPKSDEQKRKMSEAKLGKKYSSSHKSKISKSQRERYNKLGNHPNKGKKLASRPAFSEYMKKKFANGYKNFNTAGLVWWNNGIINKRSAEQPSPEFVKGRLPFRSSCT